MARQLKIGSTRTRILNTMIRTSWARRTVDAAQLLAGEFELHQIPGIRTALLRLEGAARSVRTTAERLVLRGLLVDLYLVAEKRLDTWLPQAVRTAARADLCASRGALDVRQFTAAMERLLEALAGASGGAPHEQARRWIDEHPAAAISVSDIAVLLHVHPRTLRRHFARRVGVSIQEYRRRQRAAYAAELLSSRVEKVDVIATLSGIKSRSTFYRLLKRYGKRTVPRRRAR